MKISISSTPPDRFNWPFISALIVIVCLLLFVGANAHLIYVAVNSQPDCVPHAKTAEDQTIYRAARSAC